MMNDEQWLCLQRASAQQDLQKATRDLFQRAPTAAMRFVGDKPGVSMAIAVAAGFATGFAAVRIATSDPPEPETKARPSRDATSWIHSATSNLRAFVSAAALVKALSHELSAASGPASPEAHS